LKEIGQQFQCPKQRATAQLLLGVADNNAQEVGRVLQQGVDLDSRNEHNETALMVAAEHGYTAVMKVLLSAGADVNATDDNGWTALMIASINGDPMVVTTLLKHDADLAVADDMVRPATPQN
jgi:ankyrin repeat protein